MSDQDPAPSTQIDGGKRSGLIRTRLRKLGWLLWLGGMAVAALGAGGVVAGNIGYAGIYTALAGAIVVILSFLIKESVPRKG